MGQGDEGGLQALDYANEAAVGPPAVLLLGAVAAPANLAFTVVQLLEHLVAERQAAEGQGAS